MDWLSSWLRIESWLRVVSWLRGRIETCGCWVLVLESWHWISKRVQVVKLSLSLWDWLNCGAVDNSRCPSFKTFHGQIVDLSTRIPVEPVVREAKSGDNLVEIEAFSISGDSHTTLEINENAKSIVELVVGLEITNSENKSVVRSGDDLVLMLDQSELVNIVLEDAHKLLGVDGEEISATNSGGQIITILFHLESAKDWTAGCVSGLAILNGLLEDLDFDGGESGHSQREEEEMS